MQNVKLHKMYIVASINLSAPEWELYDKEGADLAAHKMNRELEQCLVEGDFQNIYNRVLSPHREFGATDTEPDYILQRILKSLGLQTDLV
jgi:hypothetical protein